MGVLANALKSQLKKAGNAVAGLGASTVTADNVSNPTSARNAEIRKFNSKIPLKDLSKKAVPFKENTDI